MSNQNRVQRGVPQGGQFAQSTKNESGASIDDVDPPMCPRHGGPLGSDPRCPECGVLTDPDRDRLIAEFLGDGPPLTADEERLLDILMDPDINDSLGYYDDEDVLENLASAGNDHWAFEGAQDVAARLREHYDKESPRGAGVLEFDVAAEGGGYTVGVYLGYDTGGSLVEGHDAKYLVPERVMPEASGLRKALYIADTLDSDYQSVRAKARRLGLIPGGPPGEPDLYAARRALEAFDRAPDDPEAVAEIRDALESFVRADKEPPPVWPQTDEERAAFADYQYEVANGDTAVGFRDWYIGYLDRS